MQCKICRNRTKEIFKAMVINLLDTSYYQCLQCKYIQTEEPSWLEKAYEEEVISSLDVGYITRNIMFSEITSSFIKLIGLKMKDRYLDYGGGYRMFVRLMRGKGFNLFRQNLYCQNFFVKNFDNSNNANYSTNKYTLVTAFEVFEHLNDPLMEIEKMFQYSENILFSTELQPNKDFRSSEEWWYFIPETGQHISFFSKKSINEISYKFDCNYYSDNKTIHFLSKNKYKINLV